MSFMVFSQIFEPQNMQRYCIVRYMQRAKQLVHNNNTSEILTNATKSLKTPQNIHSCVTVSLDI
jgi:hypothetical protein